MALTSPSFVFRLKHSQARAVYLVGQHSSGAVGTFQMSPLPSDPQTWEVRVSIPSGTFAYRYAVVERAAGGPEELRGRRAQTVLLGDKCVVRSRACDGSQGDGELVDLFEWRELRSAGCA
jgi:hypothetical protein